MTPGFNPLDPLGSLAQILWYIVKLLNGFVYDSLAKPDIMLGGKPVMQWLFEEIWGLASYVAWSVLLVLLGALALGWLRAASHLGKAVLIAVVLGGVGAPIIWMLTGIALNVSKVITESLGTLTPPGGGTIANNAMPVSDIGTGGAQLFVYGLDMVFLALQALLIGLIVLLQLIAGSCITGALALYPLGETGRLIGRIAIYAWVDSFLIGLPVVAIFRRLSMIITVGSASDFQSQAWARASFYILTLLSIVLVVGVAMLSYNQVVRSIGGRVHSTVDGNVTTDERDRIKPVPIDQPLTTAGATLPTQQVPTNTSGNSGIVRTPNTVTAEGLVLSAAVGAVAPEIPPGVAMAIAQAALAKAGAEDTHIIPRIIPPISEDTHVIRRRTQ